MPSNLKVDTYEIDLVWKRGVRRTFQTRIDPSDHKELRTLLLAEMKKFRNDGEPFLGNYELRLRRPGNRTVLTSYVVTS
jgi:hypothetical protein